MSLWGEMKCPFLWCVLAAIVIALIQYGLVTWECRRALKDRPEDGRLDRENPYERRSWLLWLARLFWSVGLLTAPQNLIFLLVNKLTGSYPRFALEISNELRALRCDEYPVRLRPLPKRGEMDDKWAIRVREVWFGVELVGSFGVLWSEYSAPWLAVLVIWLLVCRTALLVYSILEKGPRYGVWSFPRTGTAVMVNYLCLIVQFGYLYWFVGHDVTQFDAAGPCPNEAWSTALYFSVVTITTLGYGDIAPVGGVARAVVGCETLIGVLYIVGVVQMLISSWPRR